MKTLVIDPHARTVTEEDHDGSLEAIYRLTHCSTFTSLGVAGGVDLFLDDEGLLGDLSKQAFFLIDGWPEPLAGYAMAVGVDSHGNTTAPKITLEALAKRVSWITLDEIVDRYAR